MADDRVESEDVLLELFDRFDVDENGLIDEFEFHEILRELHGDSGEEVESLEFALIDENGDGLVTFREFADWWLDRNITE